MSENNNDLNEAFEEEFEDATVITVPIDDTLSNSGEAADAKAVGDALALKADKSELAQSITVNGQSADNQGAIIVVGTEIAMSDTDDTTLRDAINATAGKTGETIPLNSEAGAPTISEAVAGISGQNATTIPMAADSSTMIATKIATMDTVDAGLQASVTALQGKTGGNIPISAGSTKTIQEAVEERVLTVNHEEADSSGNVQVSQVEFAENLRSTANQTVEEAFTERTSGGARSVDSSDAWLISLKGNRMHNGYVPEEITLTVTAPVSGITATIDRDVFVAEVSTSGTTTLTYSDGWSTTPATYGITVTGTPVNDDVITVVYVKEEAGTIVPANPQSLTATGWNIYDDDEKYARVLNYSEAYGYGIDGTYTALAFSATPTGTQTALSVSDGIITGFPAGWTDGYIHVTGGNDEDTAIWMTWDDWTEGYEGPFEAYTESTISLAAVMTSYFPNGLLRVGDVRDEISVSTGHAISRIERKVNNASNMAAVKASGRDYEYDENYIYVVRETEIDTQITLDGQYTISDHGMEFVGGSDTPALVLCMYGNNLRNKLERDVLTISQQTLNAAQQAQVQANIGVTDLLAGKLGFVQLTSVSSNSNRTYVLENDTKAIFVAFGSTAATKGFWIVNLATASVTIKDIGEASSLTMTAPSNGKVNIANSANVGTRIYAIVFAGSVADQA